MERQAKRRALYGIEVPVEDPPPIVDPLTGDDESCISLQAASFVSEPVDNLDSSDDKSSLHKNIPHIIGDNEEPVCV